MMFNCSLNQILKLWSVLEDCKSKVSAFGTDVAEVYAYTLREEHPSHFLLRQNSNSRGTESEIYGEDIKQENLDTGQSLVQICRKFSKDRNCTVLILDVYLDDVLFGSIDVFSEKMKSFEFDHRVHVKVIPN